MPTRLQNLSPGTKQRQEASFVPQLPKERCDAGAGRMDMVPWWNSVMKAGRLMDGTSPRTTLLERGTDDIVAGVSRPHLQSRGEGWRRADSRIGREMAPAHGLSLMAYGHRLREVTIQDDAFATQENSPAESFVPLPVPVAEDLSRSALLPGPSTFGFRSIVRTVVFPSPARPKTIVSKAPSISFLPFPVHCYPVGP